MDIDPNNAYFPPSGSSRPVSRHHRRLSSLTRDESRRGLDSRQKAGINSLLTVKSSRATRSGGSRSGSRSGSRGGHRRDESSVHKVIDGLLKDLIVPDNSSIEVSGSRVRGRTVQNMDNSGHVNLGMSSHDPSENNPNNPLQFRDDFANYFAQESGSWDKNHPNSFSNNTNLRGISSREGPRHRTNKSSQYQPHQRSHSHSHSHQAPDREREVNKREYRPPSGQSRRDHEWEPRNIGRTSRARAQSDATNMNNMNNMKLTRSSSLRGPSGPGRRSSVLDRRNLGSNHTGQPSSGSASNYVHYGTPNRLEAEVADLLSHLSSTEASTAYEPRPLPPPVLLKVDPPTPPNQPIGSTYFSNNDTWDDTTSLLGPEAHSLHPPSSSSSSALSGPASTQLPHPHAPVRRNPHLLSPKKSNSGTLLNSPRSPRSPRPTGFDSGPAFLQVSQPLSGPNSTEESLNTLAGSSLTPRGVTSELHNNPNNPNDSPQGRPLASEINTSNKHTRNRINKKTRSNLDRERERETSRFPRPRSASTMKPVKASVSLEVGGRNILPPQEKKKPQPPVVFTIPTRENHHRYNNSNGHNNLSLFEKLSLEGSPVPTTIRSPLLSPQSPTRRAEREREKERAEQIAMSSKLRQEQVKQLIELMSEELPEGGEGDDSTPLAHGDTLSTATVLEEIYWHPKMMSRPIAEDNENQNQTGIPRPHEKKRPTKPTVPNVVETSTPASPFIASSSSSSSLAHHHHGGHGSGSRGNEPQPRGYISTISNLNNHGGDGDGRDIADICAWTDSEPDSPGPGQGLPSDLSDPEITDPVAVQTPIPQEHVPLVRPMSAMNPRAPPFRPPEETYVGLEESSDNDVEISGLPVNMDDEPEIIPIPPIQTNEDLRETSDSSSLEREKENNDIPVDVGEEGVKIESEEAIQVTHVKTSPKSRHSTRPSSKNTSPQDTSRSSPRRRPPPRPRVNISDEDSDPGLDEMVDPSLSHDFNASLRVPQRFPMVFPDNTKVNVSEAVNDLWQDINDTKINKSLADADSASDASGEE